MPGPGRRGPPAREGAREDSAQVSRAAVLRSLTPPNPARRPGAGRLNQMFPRCGNPLCASGRIRLWRNSRVPVFEGRWACSADCLRAIVDASIGREGRSDGPGAGEWVPRIPLGLMLLEQGRLSERQLREAVESRKRTAESTGESIRLEDWLLSSGILSEAALTRAISAQWNCPVFVLTGSQPEEMASALPPFLAEALGALPVRVAGGKLLCLAFSERIDRSLSYAVEHVTGLRVAAGIARESEFRRQQAQFLSGLAPRTRFLEAEDRGALAREMAAWIEQERPLEARLARVHEVWWLRIWRREVRGAALPAREAVEDLLATVGRTGRPDEGGQTQGRKAQELEKNAVPPIEIAEGSGASCRD
jgi:hypothetical protein